MATKKPPKKRPVKKADAKKARENAGKKRTIKLRLVKDPDQKVETRGRKKYPLWLSETKLELTAKQRRFLAAYCGCGIITKAAVEAEVSRNAHHTVWMLDPAYQEAFKEAQEESADTLEEEAWRRAVDGTEKLKFNKAGEALVDPRTGDWYVEHEYSNDLLWKLLMANRPDKYREVRKTEKEVHHSGGVDHKHQVRVGTVLDDLPLDVRKALLEAIRRKQTVIEHSSPENGSVAPQDRSS